MTKKILIDETVVKQCLDHHDADDAIAALREALEVNNKAVNALAEQQAAEPVAWCPDVCPITGRPFFMWIEHHKTGQMVPTYGGPYDSYTIPVRDKDGSYCRERYDHDNGWWVTDEIDDVGIQIVSDQAYVSDDEPPASKPLSNLTEDNIPAFPWVSQSAQRKPWQGLTDEEVKHEWVVWRASIPRYMGFAKGIEAKLREKNA